jgi:histidinol-phosphate aminotransferase
MLKRPFKNPRFLIRPLVHDLHAYVPGEQPKIKELIKLNTNENPYPPSPRVLKAVKAAADARLRLYPNPTAQVLREKLAKLHGCAPENIIIGNGSDELLAMAVRAFVEPRPKSKVQSPKSKLAKAKVQYFHPSYSLYPVLADIHGAAKNAVPLSPNFTLPRVADLKRGGLWDFNAALTFITTPNAPSGCGYSTSDLEKLCRAMSGVVMLDEAYVDFAREHAMKLALKYPHVMISRTFSKAYSLCFQRVGYFVGHAELIAALDKIRDSYNVNGLGQVAALATLEDLPYYRANFRRIISTREELSRALTMFGFRVLPSQTNFILAKPPGNVLPVPPGRDRTGHRQDADGTLTAKDWLQKLREKKILVRWFNQPEIKDFLRITIGTPAEAKALVRAVKAILR